MPWRASGCTLPALHADGWGALGCAMTAAIVAVAHGSVLCPPHAAFYPLIIGNGACAGLAWVCCIKACRLVTGAEVGLILVDGDISVLASSCGWHGTCTRVRRRALWWHSDLTSPSRTG